MSYRCVAANCRNVVDLSKCILVHNIPFRENTTGQVGTDSSHSFSGMCLDGNDLVITSHISLELANTAWPKRETCVISQCFGCQPLGFHSVVVF